MSKLRFGLIASIVLNLFLAGALVAGYVSLRTGKHMLNAGSLRIAGAELPASERRPFRQALRQARQTQRSSTVASRTAKVRAAALLREASVDQAAVLAELDRARAADMMVRAAVERRAVLFAARLPAADRAKLADAMKRRAQRRAPGAE
jgi:uncharacterized membrane protein